MSTRPPAPDYLTRELLVARLAWLVAITALAIMYSVFRAASNTT